MLQDVSYVLFDHGLSCDPLPLSLVVFPSIPHRRGLRVVYSVRRPVAIQEAFLTFLIHVFSQTVQLLFLSAHLFRSPFLYFRQRLSYFSKADRFFLLSFPLFGFEGLLPTLFFSPSPFFLIFGLLIILSVSVDSLTCHVASFFGSSLLSSRRFFSPSYPPVVCLGGDFFPLLLPLSLPCSRFVIQGTWPPFATSRISFFLSSSFIPFFVSLRIVPRGRPGHPLYLSAFLL